MVRSIIIAAAVLAFGQVVPWVQLYVASRDLGQSVLGIFFCEDPFA